MSDNIKNFRLSDCEGNKGYNRVLLQLFGVPGNGKSSFINSCKFVIDGGAFVNLAKAGKDHGGSTTERVSYELTESICLVDNRGMPTMDRFQTGEIFAQLGNLLPLNEKVEWVQDFKKNIDRLMDENHKEDNLGDIIVPVFTHSVKNVIEENSEYKDDYNHVLHTARELTGINPYIVLTHKYCGGVESMKSVFKDMGLQKIYTVENYTSEDQPVVREQHEEIINFLSEVLDDIRFRMAHMKDPREEWRERFKFLINYIKETSDMTRDEQHEREAIKQALPKKNWQCVCS